VLVLNPYKKSIVKLILSILFLFLSESIFSQLKILGTGLQNQFLPTSTFLDASINSINTFNSLIKKENYRNKITSFNNPTSSDMGFNLENEIQTALKPLLAKAKNTNTQKFSQVIASLVTTPAKTASSISKTAAPAINPLFSTLLSLVGGFPEHEVVIYQTNSDDFFIHGVFLL